MPLTQHGLDSDGFGPTTWATTLLPPGSLGASEPAELMPLSASLLASRRIFQTIYATWVHSHSEMVAWAAITSRLMIHFYISLTRHPTSPVRTGDTLLVFLITAIAIWIFHRMWASGPNGAIHCAKGTGCRKIKGQWWAELTGKWCRTRHLLGDREPIPL